MRQLPIPPENHKKFTESTDKASRLPELVQQWVTGEPNDASWMVALRADGCLPGEVDFEKALVFPGSFNPLHAGHRRMMELAISKTGRAGYYELSITNADKASLTIEQLAKRINAKEIDQRFAPAGLLLSRLPMFEQKAAAFPGAIFIVGADTLRRINDLKYYASSENNFGHSIGAIAEHSVRFLVFGRDDDGRFLDQEALQLRPELEVLCDFVPREEFEMDISSSSLRSD